MNIAAASMCICHREAGHHNAASTLHTSSTPGRRTAFCVALQVSFPATRGSACAERGCLYCYKSALGTASTGRRCSNALPRKGGGTFTAREWPHTHVSLHVALEMLTPNEDGPAFVTRKRHSGHPASEFRCEFVMGSKNRNIRR